jgi:hypothetical protein
MNRIGRRINTRRLKRIAKLSATSVALVLLIILLEPMYSFLTKVTYVYLGFVLLARLWAEGFRDWDLLVVA